MTLTVSQPSQRVGDSPSALRWHQLSARYTQVRQATMQLVAPLSDEDCQVQSMPDTSPAKWHLAHVSWFFETFVLERHERDFQPFDARFRVLFNSYYEGVGEQHPRAQRGLITRPDLATVKAYRAQVDQRMHSLMANAAADARFDADRHALITLGLHHEQQHQELLLTDINHALWMGSRGALDAKAGAYIRLPPSKVAPAQPLSWSAHAGGLVDLGHDPALDGDFCFDNETPRHRVWLDAFEIASRPVNQGEFLAFMQDGGYRRPELWLSMGWAWVNGRGTPRCAPLYWQRRDGVWFSHTLHGTQAIEALAPAGHLSYFEADAYARWAGARLPTEAEWEHAARQSEAPQMPGAVWEWTQSNYNAYPGYQPASGAVGEYNGKFMCNQFVLRGGSCATPTGHIRASYRNFFPPDAQWQFSGLRLARAA
jgi:ergothioneine biosynthesis protein EgtB